MENTKHVEIYRANRMKQIVEHIGLGQVVKELYLNRDNWSCGRWLCITDTGVTIIKDERKEKVVTLYVTTMKELVRAYGGTKKIPTYLRKKVSRNESLYTEDGKTIWQE